MEEVTIGLRAMSPAMKKLVSAMVTSVLGAPAKHGSKSKREKMFFAESLIVKDPYYVILDGRDTACVIKWRDPASSAVYETYGLAILSPKDTFNGAHGRDIAFGIALAKISNVIASDGSDMLEYLKRKHRNDVKAQKEQRRQVAASTPPAPAALLELSALQKSATAEATKTQEEHGLTEAIMARYKESPAGMMMAEVKQQINDSLEKAE